MLYSFADFLSSNPDFYIIYYLYNFNGTSFDSSIISFNNADTSTAITVQTNNNLKVGKYHLTIVAKFT